MKFKYGDKVKIVGDSFYKGQRGVVKDYRLSMTIPGSKFFWMVLTPKVFYQDRCLVRINRDLQVVVNVQDLKLLTAKA